MDTKIDKNNIDSIVFMLLEGLKSSGTFDEIRRYCISNIDSKVWNINLCFVHQSCRVIVDNLSKLLFFIVMFL